MNKVTLFILWLACLQFAGSAYSQNSCTDFSYSINYKEYKVVSDDISLEEIGDLNLYNFMVKRKKKRVRKFLNEDGNPVKVSTVIDHDNYYAETVTLPIISVYGQSSFSNVLQSFAYETGMEGGVSLGTSTSWMDVYSAQQKGLPDQYSIPLSETTTEFGTIVNNEASLVNLNTDSDTGNDFTESVQYIVPNDDQLDAWENAGYQVNQQDSYITIEGQEISIEYDLQNYVIRYTFPDGNYQIRNYSWMETGQILLESVADVRFDALVNGICVEHIIIRTYGDYSCEQEWIQPYEQEGAMADWRLYPNPTNDILQVSIPASWQDQEATIEIHDITGKRIHLHKQHLDSRFTLPVQQLLETTGMYILTVSGEHERHSQKFLFTQK